MAACNHPFAVAWTCLELHGSHNAATLLVCSNRSRVGKTALRTGKRSRNLTSTRHTYSVGLSWGKMFEGRSEALVYGDRIISHGSCRTSPG